MIFTFIMLAALAITASGYLLVDVVCNWELYHCKLRHKKHHVVRMVEYGSFYFVMCRKCSKGWAEKRP